MKKIEAIVCVYNEYANKERAKILNKVLAPYLHTRTRTHVRPRTHARTCTHVRHVAVSYLATWCRYFVHVTSAATSAHNKIIF